MNVAKRSPEVVHLSFGLPTLEKVLKRLKCKIGKVREHTVIICEVFRPNLLRGGANHFLK